MNSIEGSLIESSSHLIVTSQKSLHRPGDSTPRRLCQCAYRWVIFIRLLWRNKTSLKLESSCSFCRFCLPALLLLQRVWRDERRFYRRVSVKSVLHNVWRKDWTGGKISEEEEVSRGWMTDTEDLEENELTPLHHLPASVNRNLLTCVTSHLK